MAKKKETAPRPVEPTEHDCLKKLKLIEQRMAMLKQRQSVELFLDDPMLKDEGFLKVTEPSPLVGKDGKKSFNVYFASPTSYAEMVDKALAENSKVMEELKNIDIEAYLNRSEARSKLEII